MLARESKQVAAQIVAKPVHRSLHYIAGTTAAASPVVTNMACSEADRTVPDNCVQTNLSCFGEQRDTNFPIPLG